MNIFAVTWYEDKLYEVIVRDDRNICDCYDIDFTSAGQGYYHWSGCWTCDGEPQNLDSLLSGIKTLDDIIGYYNLIEGKLIYCKICDDFMPEDWPCQHLVWNDEDGCWGGPGSDEYEA